MIDMNFIKGFLDKNGIVTIWPSKKKKQYCILQYIASKIPENTDFTEKEFNELINKLCAFNDPALIRRELYIKKHIDRNRDGSKYWKMYNK